MSIRLPCDHCHDESRGSFVTVLLLYLQHRLLYTQLDTDCNTMIVVLQNVLKFWLDKGVAGFRVDAFKYAYEVQNISLNEQLPVSINIWIRL
jgi:hypothetical protein